MKNWEKLYNRRTFGIKLGLDVEMALLNGLGNPERSLKIIHVAGTNGKGSVCAILESVLTAAGYKTGLYTSPHLIDFNERFRIGGEQIGDDRLEQLVNEVEKVSDDVAETMGQEPTFFECSTAIALKYFADEKVDFAILETGMGGRLDATNVVTPQVSVITRIGLEHTEYLGDDIETIAGEKAGIIKSGIPVVCGMMDDLPRTVVRKAATDKKSLFINTAESVAVNIKEESLSGTKVRVETLNTSYGTMQLSLLGRHQIENMATAVAVLDFLADTAVINLSGKDIKKGVGDVNWPGRMQVLNTEPPVLLDGAHNPSAAEVLSETLKRLFKGKPLGLILGMCEDKDVSSFLKCFKGLAVKLWIVPVSNERNIAPDIITQSAKAIGIDVSTVDLAAALNDSKAWACAEDAVVCITGSLFLVADVLKGGTDV